MYNISELYSLDLSAVGSLVQAHGLLLGGKNLVLADSIEDYDRGVAVPLLDDDLLERLYMGGIFSIGGGRFGYRYNSSINATLVTGTRGYKIALARISSLTVNYNGKDMLISTTNEYHP